MRILKTNISVGSPPDSDTLDNCVLSKVEDQFKTLMQVVDK